MEFCWWKTFGRMGGDQLNVGDELTGRGPTLNKAGRASMPVFITRRLASEFSAICLWKMNTGQTDILPPSPTTHPPPPLKLTWRKVSQIPAPVIPPIYSDNQSPRLHFSGNFRSKNLIQAVILAHFQADNDIIWDQTRCFSNIVVKPCKGFEQSAII